MYVKDIYLFFMRNLDYKLLVLGPSDIMWVYFHLASLVAIEERFQLQPGKFGCL